MSLTLSVFTIGIPFLAYPSWAQTTEASGLPQKSSQTVPQVAFLQTSTRPSLCVLPPTSLRSQSLQAVYCWEYKNSYFNWFNFYSLSYRMFFAFHPKKFFCIVVESFMHTYLNITNVVKEVWSLACTWPQHLQSGHSCECQWRWQDSLLVWTLFQYISRHPVGWFQFPDHRKLFVFQQLLCPTVESGKMKNKDIQINMYYCMTGRTIRRNIQCEIDRIGPTEGRDDTEVKNGIISPHCQTRGIAIIDLL